MFGVASACRDDEELEELVMTRTQFCNDRQVAMEAYTDALFLNWFVTSEKNPERALMDESLQTVNTNELVFLFTGRRNIGLFKDRST